MENFNTKSKPSSEGSQRSRDGDKVNHKFFEKPTNQICRKIDHVASKSFQLRDILIGKFTSNVLSTGMNVVVDLYLQKMFRVIQMIKLLLGCSIKVQVIT